MEVKETFFKRFLEDNPPTNRTIWKNVRKYEKEGASLKIDKGRSGRKRADRSEETIEAVRLYVENIVSNVSCRRNGLALSCSSLLFASFFQRCI